MTTPLAIVADSIIEFILSLLRDPAAVQELKNDPDGTLARHGLQDVCADDIRAVAPVVYDRADVAFRPSSNGGGTPRSGNDPSSNTPTPRTGDDGGGVIRELMNIANNFYIDNRATIVDQSVNQNIWTEGGDVTQVFDQNAAVASGDDSTAAGGDIDVDNSTDNSTDIDVDIDVDGGGDTDLDEVLDTVTDAADPALGDVADDLGLPVDPAGIGLPEDLPDPDPEGEVTDAIADVADAAGDTVAATAAAPPVEDVVDDGSVGEPALDPDDSVWDTTEAVLDEEPLYDDEILEDQ